MTTTANKIQKENVIVKASTKKVKTPKIDLEIDNFDEEETETTKTPRISMFEKVKNRLNEFYNISEVQFLNYALLHKGKKQNVNQFAESLMKQIFFDEKVIDKIKG